MREMPFSPEMMATLGLVAGLDGRELEGNSNTGLVDLMKEALADAFAKEILSEQQARVIYLMYIQEGLTQEMVANYMGITQQAVSLYHRNALKKLEKHIKTYCNF